MNSNEELLRILDQLVMGLRAIAEQLTEKQSEILDQADALIGNAVQWDEKLSEESERSINKMTQEQLMKKIEAIVKQLT
jgi:predicted PurR-regulated permease PerM